jgi:hypothetical protein
MKLRAALLATVQFFSASASFAAGVLVSGPMLGYAAHRETLVWVETKGAKEVALRYWLAGQPATAQGIVRSELSVTPAGGQIVKFRPGLLEQGATYEYAMASGRPSPTRSGSKPARSGNGARRRPISASSSVRAPISTRRLTTAPARPMARAPKFSVIWPPAAPTS